MRCRGGGGGEEVDARGVDDAGGAHGFAQIFRGDEGADFFRVAHFEKDVDVVGFFLIVEEGDFVQGGGFARGAMGVVGAFPMAEVGYFLPNEEVAHVKFVACRAGCAGRWRRRPGG